MGSIGKEYFKCYHCGAESILTVVYSQTRFHPLVYRTDGYCIDKPDKYNEVLWCTYCEKFVLTRKLESSDREVIERKSRIKNGQSQYSFFDLQKKYFHGSKIYQAEFKKLHSDDELGLMKSEKWFRGLHSCIDFIFALKSPELKDESEVRYSLKLNYWRQMNKWGVDFLDDENELNAIYSSLMEAWNGHADERYMFKAELLRNTGKFRESNKLLKKPEAKYLPVVKKYKAWAKVIITLNSLKYKQSMDINIK